MLRVPSATERSVKLFADVQAWRKREQANHQEPPGSELKSPRIHWPVRRYWKIRQYRSHNLRHNTHRTWQKWSMPAHCAGMHLERCGFRNGKQVFLLWVIVRKGFVFQDPAEFLFDLPPHIIF